MNDGIISPYRDIDGMTPYRGIWHAHVQGAFPGFAEAREMCRLGDYSFLGVTEHDNRYVQMEWAEKDWYSVVDEEFLIIRGFEATHPLGHITCLGFLPDQTGVDVQAAYRIRFDKEKLDAGYDGFLKKASAAGAFLALNHPYKWRGRAVELAAQPDVSCLHAIELYNGNQAGKALAQGYTMDLYDDCLSLGWRIWGGANPDCHSWDVGQHDGPFNGYSVVYAAALNRQEILESLKQGRFYASTGLRVDMPRVDDNCLQVAAHECRRIAFFGQHGRLLEAVDGDQACYRFRGDEGYVRTELEGGYSDPLRAGGEPARAWLQPVWLK